MVERAKPDGMLVDDGMLVHTQRELEEVVAASDEGVLAAPMDLAIFEPILAEYITERCLGIAGRLALVGSPTEVVRGAYNDIMMIAFTAVQAMRRGQYEFWQMSMEDTEYFN
jgi:hypothetical protein